jgi:hypothetical protein
MKDAAGRLNDARSPRFARRRGGQIGTPAPRLRGGCAVIDPAGRAHPAVCVVERTTNAMRRGTMSDYDALQRWIYELRAELAGCRMSRREREKAQTELAALVARAEAARSSP